MKTSLKLILLSALGCAASIGWFATTTVPSSEVASTSAESITPTSVKMAEADRANSIDEPTRAAVSPVDMTGPIAMSEDMDPMGSVSMERWQARMEELVRECGSREQANERLIGELDCGFEKWVRSTLESLDGASPIERYDMLAQADARIRRLAESILGHLGIAGGRRYDVLPVALEAIAAEVQFAEARGTHEQRVAMLRLHREREDRYARMLATNAGQGDGESLVRSEIEPWYEAQLSALLGISERE